MMFSAYAARAIISLRDNERVLEFTLGGGVGAWAEAEIDIRRSRFIGRLVRVESEHDARDVIESARQRHGDARHHCSAFVLGSGTQPDQVRRSHDDGEPSGTAGRPILDVLNGRHLIDCVAVVTRYFGGTLLGAGGLVRAYSDATTAAVEQATVAPGLVLRQRRQLFRLPLPHADAGRIEAELRQRGVVVRGTEYDDVAVMTLTTALNGERALAALVAGVTAGARMLEPAGIEWVDAPPPTP
ncbi:YigZ family protein [Salinibacterium sp. TMP30]|uniref:IMPACT family protein n=1 Tax=Salinibacterium sp. TMP30 TaxID=3138237 RepID=UPI0031397E82